MELGSSNRLRTTWRALCLAGIGAAAMTALGAGAANAGRCPADKVVANAAAGPTGARSPKGVTDTVLGFIDLAQEESVGVRNRQFRLRRLVVEPGGEVPWHSHGNRPALIYIVEGEITEYANTCAVPILHRAGEVAPETHATSHWWKNTGSRRVVLISADLFPTGDDAKMM